MSIVVGSIAGGMSYEEIQREYNVSPEDIQVALDFHNELIQARDAEKEPQD